MDIVLITGTARSMPGPARRRRTRTHPLPRAVVHPGDERQLDDAATRKAAAPAPAGCCDQHLPENATRRSVSSSRPTAPFAGWLRRRRSVGVLMRIAMVAPVAWRTPPRHYGPWEQVTSVLTEGLVAAGVDVT